MDVLSAHLSVFPADKRIERKNTTIGPNIVIKQKSTIPPDAKKMYGAAMKTPAKRYTATNPKYIMPPPLISQKIL